MRATSATEAGDKLIRIREQARKALKQLARTHHPDVTGGDEAKAAMFVAANNANDWLQAAQIQPRRVVMRPPAVTMWQSTGTGTVASTVSWSTTGWTQVMFR